MLSLKQQCWNLYKLFKFYLQCLYIKRVAGEDTGYGGLLCLAPPLKTEGEKKISILNSF